MSEGRHFVVLTSQTTQNATKPILGSVIGTDRVTGGRGLCTEAEEVCQCVN